ncbi:MAG: Gfo/Idh/MocA family oxidoreductase, partial [Planctomycetota bacterium]|nr:Gfo/Idh/MocA family oxidoreductase [Planctomycetota bacterium]
VVHIIYAALFVAGFHEPAAVSGVSLTKFGNRNDVLPGSWGMWNWKEYDVEDNAFAFVRLEGGGAMAIEASFVANIPEEVFSFQVFGTKGGGRMSPFAYMGEQAGTLVNVQPVWLPKSEAHAREIADFVGAIRGECRVGVTGEEGLKVTRIIDAIYESAKLGKEVRVPKLKI